MRLSSIVSLLLTTACTAVNAFSDPLTFAARLSLEGNGVIFTTGDFNNDGNEDIISVVPIPNSPTNDYEISVQLGNGNGAFLPGLRYDLGPGFVPTAIAAADVNGDGLLDVVVLSPSTNALYVVSQREGKHPAITPFEVPNASGGINLAIGDINGDGQPDIVIPSHSGTIVLLNEGRSNFGPTIVVNTLSASFVLLADINRDGKTDLVLSGSGAVEILLGDGHGNFAVDNGFPRIFGVATEIAVADFNQDGNPDIATTSGEVIELAFGKGDGTFADPEAFPLPTAFTQGIGLFAGDLNEDGRPDLLALASGSSGTSMLAFVNQGNGLFGSPSIYPVQGVGTSVQAAPLVTRAAGSVGLALVPSPGAQSISVFVNTGSAAFQEGLLAGPSVQSNTLAMADFNGDGLLDIATISSAGLTVLLNTGQEAGLFVTTTTLPFSSGLVVAGDFNSNRIPDLVNINGSSGELLVGEGTGQFRLKLPPFNIGAPAMSAVAADMNGDGNADLVTSAPAIILGTGDGRFQEPYVSPYDNCGSSVLAVGDFNGDGKPDILSTCNTVLQIFPGNGDGTLGSPFTVTQDANGITGAVVGDFNHDGITDIAFTSTFYGPSSTATAVYIELGNGDGTFQQKAYYLVPVESASAAFSIASGSFNNDENVDLAVLDQGDALVAVLPGNGDGTFAQAILYETGTHPTCIMAASLHGFDRASREDLVFCSAQGVSIDLNTTR